MDTPVIVSFPDLIKNHSYDNGQMHTHTYFGIGGPKKLCIPEPERDAFYRAYQRYIETNSIETLSGRYGFNSITEKTQPVFNMFADLDLKLSFFAEGRIDIAGAVHMIRDITDAFYQVVGDLFGMDELPYPITAFRMFYKCHIYFPNLPVTRDMGKKICAEVERKLAGRYTWLKAEKIVDTSVYTSGLRMLGSHKGAMARTGPDEKRKHHAHFGDHVPFHHFYRIGQLQDDGSVDYQETIALDDLQTTSIICNDGTESLSFRNQHGGSLVPPDGRGRDTSTASQANNADVDGDGDDETREATGQDTEERSIPFPDQEAIVSYLTYAFSQLRGSVEEANLIPNISSVKRYEETGVVLAVLTPQPCPFICRAHRRTAERGVSPLFVVLTPLGCSLKCNKCDGRRIPLIAPGSALTAILRFTPERALRDSLLEQTHENISEFIFQLLKDQFAATPMADSGNFVWHFYDEKYHRWIRREQIIAAISGKNGPVKRAYKAYLRKIQTSGEFDEAKLTNMKKLWTKLRFSLGTTGFIRGGVLPLLARKLDHYWSYEKSSSPDSDGFSGKLDDNPRVMGFRNGVWDFATGVFRDGSPSDYISMSTHINYVPYDEIPMDIRNSLREFLEKIFSSQEYLDYTIRELASTLNGTPSRQRFFIMTGAGANGKSTLIRLLNLALGDYAGESSITLFTHQRPSAERPTPEIMQLKGKRVVTTSEANAKDSMNLGTIKWLTGGDRITARALRENNQSFYLQATFFCLTNDIPPINATQEDFGTWRRIKPVCFKSRFVENPDPANPNEKLTDPKINEHLEVWKAAFASLLVKVYIDNQNELPPPIPAEFNDLWRQLQNRNDIFRRFVTEVVTRTDAAFTPMQQVWDTFAHWLTRLRLRKDTQYDQFEKHMLTILGEAVEMDGIRGWHVELRTLPAVVL